MSGKSKISSGYKKTEIGIIPEDWEIKKLGEICRYKNGTTLEKYIDDNGKYFIITLDSLTIEGKLKKRHLRTNFKGDFLDKDDIVMILSDVAHGDFLGLTALIPEDNKYLLNQRVAALKCAENLVPFYLSMYINHKQKYFKKVGQGSSQQNLNKDDVLSFEVCYPSNIKEQRAIANVLSDFDKLIESLDKLIEKKKLIKKGAMQELLTGKKRLPGFTGEWVTKKLGEIGKITDGDWILRANYTNKGVRLLQVGDIGVGKFLNKSRRFISKETAEKLKCTFVKPEKDILISRMPEPIGRACLAPLLDCQYIVAVDISVLRLNEDIFPQFVVYKLNSEDNLKNVNKFVAGGTRERISRKNLEEIELYLPPHLEQQAIAKILSDMDAEIEALEQKKKKYEKIKKGAMELLLTGKIRLKDHIKEVLA